MKPSNRDYIDPNWANLELNGILLPTTIEWKDLDIASIEVKVELDSSMTLLLEGEITFETFLLKVRDVMTDYCIMIKDYRNAKINEQNR